MIKLEKHTVMNLENAVRGTRNPLNSWAKSDSYVEIHGHFVVGKEDLNLCKKLCRAGGDHRKFMRQIFVSVDITAPIYWWKEFDTYKVGTVANSTSTMHKIHSKPIEITDFSFDNISIDFGNGDESLSFEFLFEKTVEDCETLRRLYAESKDVKYWRALIQLLPESYNQLRTVTMNYENLLNMYHARKNHKLDEWHTFCDWIKKLPYSELITGEE